MKKQFAMAIPILPGQTERWRKFTNALKGEKANEFKASRDALSVHERTYLQQTPNGDHVIVTLEGENPEEAFKKFGQGKDSFTKWFLNEVKEIHGMDMSSPPTGKFPELVVDSGELKTATKR